ncbi:MAG: hypothetical protein J0H87_08315 [Holosporales bacterium]|nr:hypothetical protein [Holosporales bacterium]
MAHSNEIQGLTLRIEADHLEGVEPTLKQAVLDIQASLTQMISQEAFAATLKTLVHKQVVGSAIDPGLAMVVGLAAGLATCGWGSVLMNSLAESMFGMMTVVSSTGVSATVPAVTLSSLGVAMADAGLSAICSQAASSLLKTGSLKEMSQDLTSSQFAKSLTITLTSAGLMNKLSGTLKLPPQSKGWEHLKVNATRSLVTTPLHVFIGGEKPEEALLDGVKSCVANTVGSFIAGKIGDAFDFQKIDEIERLLAHGGGGALSGLIVSIGDGDLLRGMASGAIGAMTAKLASDLFSQELNEQEENLISQAQEEGRSLSQKEITDFRRAVQLRADMAKVVGAFSAFALGQDVGIASLTANNAVEYNCVQHVLIGLAAADVMLELYSLTHPEEAEAYKQKVIQAVADKTGLAPETIEESFNGLLMVGSVIGGGKGSLLKGLGATLLKSEVGKKLLEKVASKQALKKVAKDIDTSSFTKETKELVGKNHKFKEQLLARRGESKADTTLRAAQKEMKGQQIEKAIERGIKYNHIEKAQSAQRGLTRHIQRINNRLSYLELPQVERQALQKELSQSSKLLDYAKQFLKDNS